MAKASSIWKKWRVSKLLSQARMAAALGVTERTVRNIEQGKVTPSYISQARFEELKARHLRNARKG
jgi:DNA-binding XRE family transcriptional regulator